MTTQYFWASKFLDFAKGFAQNVLREPSVTFTGEELVPPGFVLGGGLKHGMECYSFFVHQRVPPGFVLGGGLKHFLPLIICLV